MSHHDIFTSKASADERIARTVADTVGVFNNLELDYAVFGSCGIQTYFSYFFRLPNDIDIIIHSDSMPRLKEYCMANECPLVEEVGRTKMYLEGFPIHIIPEVFSVIDNTTNTIVAQIDLRDSLCSYVSKVLKMRCASISPQINVASLELCLFLELIRTVNTNSIMTIYFVFRFIDIDRKKFQTILQDNSQFANTICWRLNEYPSFISQMDNHSKVDLMLAQERIWDLLIFINPNFDIETAHSRQFNCSS